MARRGHTGCWRPDTGADRRADLGPLPVRSGHRAGADPVRGIPGADPTGRATPTGGLPVGEELTFFLELNRPPSWSGWDLDGWRQAVGPLLRLRLECYRDGWEPWILPGEIKIISGRGEAEV